MLVVLRVRERFSKDTVHVRAIGILVTLLVP